MRKELIAAAMGLALALGSPLAGIAGDQYALQAKYRRLSKASRNNFGQRYPRSRKTTTAAQLKRAATKRRNIEKRK